MNIVLEIKKYFKIFLDILGRNIFLILIFTVLSTFAEAFGIMMVLPLLEAFSDTPINEKNIFMVNIIRNIFAEHINLDEKTFVLLILLFICGLFVLKGILYFVSLAISAYMRGKLLEKLKCGIMYELSNLKYSEFVKNNSGYYTNILNEQINRSLIAFQKLMLLCGNIFSAIIFTGCAFYTSFKFGLLALASGLFVIIVLKGLSNYVRMLSRKTALLNGSLANMIIQYVQNFKYVRSTSQYGFFSSHLNPLIKKLASYEIKTAVSAALTQSVREPIAVIVIILSLLTSIFYFNDNISNLIVSLALFYKCFTSVFRIQSTWQNVLEYIGSVELVRNESIRYSNNIEKNSFLKLDDISRIEFIDVSFRYENTTQFILNNIKFSISKSNTIGFVGKSGCGKSTLIDLISLILNPSSGSILINGIKSHQLDKNFLRSKIGYVTQENVIFDGTIKENIVMDNPMNLSLTELDSKITNVCADASILEFIKTLPCGFETRVGDRGINLSGGQKQRIFIARELFRSPELLILDEATSSLDSKSERNIQNSVDALKGKLTIILIAHRLSTLKNCDLIYVINEGQIAEFGSYETLSRDTKSLFYSLT